LGERALYPVFGGVDARPGLAARLRLELAEALQRLGEDPALAEVARLDALELGGVGRGTELRDRFGDDWVEVVHRGGFRRLRRHPSLAGGDFSMRRASPSPGSRA